MESPNLARLLDIPFLVEASLKGPSLRVSQLLALKPGSLIATTRPAGENVDVFAAKAYIGSGELNVVDGRTVVRMVKFSG